MTSSIPIDIFRAGNIVGEGILWDPRREALWWTDIQGRCMHRYDWALRSTEIIDTPDRVGSFGLVAAREEFIVAFAKGIALYHPFKTSMESLHHQVKLDSGVRFNDGRVDRQGRFWPGTMVEGPQKEASGCLYSVNAARTVRCEARGIRIANGLASVPTARECILRIHRLEPSVFTISPTGTRVWVRRESGRARLASGSTMDLARGRSRCLRSWHQCVVHSHAHHPRGGSF